MKKHLEQSIMSWVGDVKAQVHLMKDIEIKLADLLTIVVLTSSLPHEYNSVIVALDAVKPDELTLELAISQLLNEEECHLSRKQHDDYKVSLIKGKSDSSNAAFAVHWNDVYPPGISFCPVPVSDSALLILRCLIFLLQGSLWLVP